MGLKIDIRPGDVFGKWTVICENGRKPKNGVVLYRCQCGCGTIRDVSSDALRGGRSLSCGCARNVAELKKNVTPPRPPLPKVITNTECANYTACKVCRALNVTRCAKDCFAFRPRRTINMNPCVGCQKSGISCEVDCFLKEEVDAEMARRRLGI